MFWPAQILEVVGDLAVVRVPGGLVALDDPTHALTAGAVTIIVTSAPDVQPAAGLQLGTWTVRRGAGICILQRDAAAGCPPVRMPLFLQQGELGDRVQLTVAVPAACPHCDPGDAWSHLVATTTGADALSYLNSLFAPTESRS